MKFDDYEWGDILEIYGGYGDGVSFGYGEFLWPSGKVYKGDLV